MEDQFVYVSFDIVYEKVICVHNAPDKTCPLCRNYVKTKLKDGWNAVEEEKCIVQTELQDE